MNINLFKVGVIIFFLSSCASEIENHDEGSHAKDKETDSGMALFGTGEETLNALKDCMVGRCEEGMPDYNFGFDFYCSQVRTRVYNDCRDNQRASVTECNKQADFACDLCAQNPCEEIYRSCKKNDCNPATNSWDCHRKVGDTVAYGYWRWKEGKWEWVNGDKSNPFDWDRAVCKPRKERCEAQVAAKMSDVLPPIERRVCSSILNSGHNCHHAASSVCSCLKERGVNVEVVVLDGKGLSDENPGACSPGDVYHSMLTVNYKDGQRCLIESQRKCTDIDPDGLQDGYPIDPGCCWGGRTGRVWDDLYKNPECQFAFQGGPFKATPRTFKNPSVYECGSFLRSRGTCEAQSPVPPPPQVEPTQELPPLPSSHGCEIIYICKDQGKYAGIGWVFKEGPTPKTCSQCKPRVYTSKAEYIPKFTTQCDEEMIGKEKIFAYPCD